MRREVRKALLAVLLAAAVGGSQAVGRAYRAIDVRIVVHPATQIDRLNREDLARIYLGKKTLWDSGARIVPCLLREESPVTQAFVETDLRKTVPQYRAYWKRRLFSGGGAPPRTFSSSGELLDYVASNQGAIGVVDGPVNDDRVVVVVITE